MRATISLPGYRDFCGNQFGRNDVIRLQVETVAHLTQRDKSTDTKRNLVPRSAIKGEHMGGSRLTIIIIG